MKVILALLVGAYMSSAVLSQQGYSPYHRQVSTCFHLHRFFFNSPKSVTERKMWNFSQLQRLTPAERNNTISGINYRENEKRVRAVSS